jgi:hypothetical protein
MKINPARKQNMNQMETKKDTGRIEDWMKKRLKREHEG